MNSDYDTEQLSWHRVSLRHTFVDTLLFWHKDKWLLSARSVDVEILNVTEACTKFPIGGMCAAVAQAPFTE